MKEDLAYWQARLRDHFGQLASLRSRAGGRAPVYALEHGLEAREVQAIAAAVRAHVSKNVPSPDHALPWIVYATEIGYGYSGDEYWQTFEEQTPGWTVLGDRYWLRRCYQRFRAEFGGAQPTGAWAEHFSIICWPITHAILPKDLQRQLARTLYDLRHSFYAELFESPQKLGQFIATRSWGGTSRFQNFAENAELAGQISAALLLEGRLGTASLIHPPTLRRIGADLEGERRAREWLRGARRGAQERATVRGLALGRGPASSTVRGPDEARAEVATLGIEPRLVLRPTASNGSCWEVSLEIPDLSHLLFRYPQARDVLTGSRCVVTGAAGRPLARGRCLHGAQRVTLTRWPSEDEVLLQFEQRDAQLEYLFRAECLLRPRPRRLFRIASDGMAYELRSLRVRPGERYVLVSTAGPVAANAHVRPVELECQGVHGVLLDLPVALTDDWEEALRRLGLGQARTIEVWPAGLSAVAWDGEGHTEWLAPERPCLAVQTDYEVGELQVSMGSLPDESVKLTSVAAGEPIFLQFPPLPVGLHTVRFSTRSHSDTGMELRGALDVLMRVREARPWEAGVARSGPLVVQLDPPRPTLECLWEGQLDIEIRGPLRRNMKCVLSLFERDGAAPTCVETLPPLPVPLLPAQWRAHFERHVRESKRVQDVYDTARLCRLEFAADELGTFTLECEREFVPVRWAVCQRGGDAIARLIDDSGAQGPPDMEYFSFDLPTEAVRLTSSLEWPVKAPGGLFLARRDGAEAAHLAVPRTFRSLGDLGTTPRITPSARSVEAVCGALEHARHWQTARSSGDILSSHRRRNVLVALAHHVLAQLGGDQWARSESTLTGGAVADLTPLKHAVANRRDQAGIAAAIGLEIAALANADVSARVARLAEIAESFGVLRPAARDQGNSPSWLAEFALRIASSPGEVAEWAGDRLRPTIQELLQETPVLARAARYMVIATDRYRHSRTAPGELYAGWGWP